MWLKLNTAMVLFKFFSYLMVFFLCALAASLLTELVLMAIMWNWLAAWHSGITLSQIN